MIKEIDTYRWKKIWVITITWTILSVLQFLIGLDTILEMDSDHSLRHPTDSIYASVILGFMAGFIGGNLLVFFWDRWLRALPLGNAI